MLRIDYENCTGCGACIQKCPKDCISWEEGELGFCYPVINVDNCIECNQCEGVCHVGKVVEKPEFQDVYALVNNDPEILAHSTSGGAFSAIAETVLKDGGVVYGCSMQEDFKVCHIRIANISDLEKLRGSKYVQSDLGNTFRLVEEDLKNDHKVLFSGTPCQIAALKCFLGKKSDKLVTIDIVCHGVGSQAYFDKFVEFLEQSNGRVETLAFRDKKYLGWSCGGVIRYSRSSNKKNKERPFYNHDNYYYSYFLSSVIYRKSCYSCPYANLQRQGDITLGDFWGVESLKLPVDSYNGCSLVIVNTEKGKRVFDSLVNVSAVKTKIDLAIKHNAQLVAPSMMEGNRKKRIYEYKHVSGSEIQKIFCKNNRLNIIKGKIKSVIPYRLKVKLRAIISK